MNPEAIIATVTTVIGFATEAIQAGRDAAPYFLALYNTFKGGTDDVTQEDLDALIATVTALHNDFQTPLDPAGA